MLNRLSTEPFGPPRDGKNIKKLGTYKGKGLDFHQKVEYGRA